MKQFDELQAILDASKSDFEKFFENGNAAAGTRVRKSMLALGKITKATRDEVTRIKNEKP
ncbi:MAG: histone H1 [Leadbetterella sp.]